MVGKFWKKGFQVVGWMLTVYVLFFSYSILKTASVVPDKVIEVEEATVSSLNNSFGGVFEVFGMGDNSWKAYFMKPFRKIDQSFEKVVPSYPVRVTGYVVVGAGGVWVLFKWLF